MATEMATELTPQELAKHVTIWNRRERRKIAGNAAPLRRNLSRYLSAHPECEEYKRQDKDPSQLFCDEIDPITGEPISVQNEHVPIWHRIERRKVTGNAAPLRKNLVTYLKKNPNCEVYDGQDKQPHQQQHHPSAPASNWHYSLANLNSPVDVHAHAHTHTHVQPDALSRVTAPTSPIAVSAASPVRTYQMHHQTHQPVNAATEMPNKEPNWQAPAPCVTEIHPNACQRSQPMPIPQPIPVNDLPFHEMASSWSNNPDWISHITSVHSPTNTFSCTLPFNSHVCESPMDTTPDNEPNAMPISDDAAREREAITPSSPAHDTSAMDYAAAFLCVTPRSIDLEHDALQFSPSTYLLSSLSLPKGSPSLPSCQTANPSILGTGNE